MIVNEMCIIYYHYILYIKTILIMDTKKYLDYEGVKYYFIDNEKYFVYNSLAYKTIIKKYNLGGHHYESLQHPRASLCS